MLSAVFMCPVILFVGDDLLQLTLTWNQKARGSACRVPVCRLFVRACLQTITRGKRRQTGTRQSNIPRKSRQNGTRQSAVRRKSWKNWHSAKYSTEKKSENWHSEKCRTEKKSENWHSSKYTKEKKSANWNYQQTGTRQLAMSAYWHSANWQCQQIGTRQTGLFTIGKQRSLITEVLWPTI